MYTVTDVDGDPPVKSPLVMSPVQRFHCCRQDRCACGRQHRQDDPSAMGWNERCVVVLLHENALGRACQDKKVISKQLSKLCVPKLCRAAQGKGNCSCMRTRSCSRERAAQTECTCSDDENKPLRIFYFFGTNVLVLCKHATTFPCGPNLLKRTSTKMSL